MTRLQIVRFVHLVAAATWTGGLVVLGPLVFALRRSGARGDAEQERWSREATRAAARIFARITWTAMALAVITGLAQVVMMGLPATYRPLQLKIGLVLTAISVAAVHQVTARRSSPPVSRTLEITILLVSLGIFAAAVMI